MCGILGIVARSPVNQLLYDGLLLLQHRGQDAAGIVTAEHNSFHMHKAPGMVRDVFRTRNMRALPGDVGLGQVRYPTAGGNTGFKPDSSTPSQAAPCDACHDDARTAGVNDTTVATASNKTSARTSPNTPPSVRSISVKGVACTISRTRRASSIQTTSASRKVTANDAPWFSAEPGAPIGRCGANSALNSCAAT